MVRVRWWGGGRGVRRVRMVRVAGRRERGGIVCGMCKVGFLGGENLVFKDRLLFGLKAFCTRLSRGCCDSYVGCYLL